MLDIAELGGMWRRSLISWPDGTTDTTSRVTWLQGAAAFADLRQPVWPDGWQFQAACRDALSQAECEMLAWQQGFAGEFLRRGEAFEWVRMIDFQPPQPLRDIGLLRWQDGVLVEQGVAAAYTEHWHREPALARSPCAAITLRSRTDGRCGSLLRVGEQFMFARDRLVRAAGSNLAEAVAAAATTQDARQLVDLEISLGSILGERWTITRSTLPYRAGAAFRACAHRSFGLAIADTAPDGAAMNAQWEIIGAQGDTSILLNANPEKI